MGAIAPAFILIFFGGFSVHWLFSLYAAVVGVGVEFLLFAHAVRYTRETFEGE